MPVVLPDDDASVTPYCIQPLFSDPEAKPKRHRKRTCLIPELPPRIITFSTVMANDSGNRFKNIFGTKPSSNASASGSRPKKSLSEREPDATLVDDRFPKDPARDRQRDRAIDIELPICKSPYPRFAGL